MLHVRVSRFASSILLVVVGLVTTNGCQSSPPVDSGDATEVDPDAGQFGASQNVSELGAMSAEELHHITGMAAHHLCSGTFVVGRDLNATRRRSSPRTWLVFATSAGRTISSTASTRTP